MSALRNPWATCVVRSQPKLKVIDAGLSDSPEVEVEAKSTVGKRIIQGAVAVGTAVAAGVSQAAIDVSAATTAITTDGSAAITAIGLAMLGLAAIAVTFKWAKASIFG
jgi:hypothetical protein